jgi:hypothetical protein
VLLTETIGTKKWNNGMMERWKIGKMEDCKVQRLLLTFNFESTPKSVILATKTQKHKDTQKLKQ